MKYNYNFIPYNYTICMLLFAKTNCYNLPKYIPNQKYTNLPVNFSNKIEKCFPISSGEKKTII